MHVDDIATFTSLAKVNSLEVKVAISSIQCYMYLGQDAVKQQGQIQDFRKGGQDSMCSRKF